MALIYRKAKTVKRLRKYRCDACHQSLNKVPQAPMLHDHDALIY
jgi:hypothetical protein